MMASGGHGPGLIDKDRPTAEWIASLRKRFPCEAEIDRVLTRKLERRAGPGYSPLSLDTLVQATQALLRSKLSSAFEIFDARWLSGGASKLQMAFTLDWTPPGAARTRTPMVLRMEPSESIVETSRLREFQIIKAFEGVVPIPPTYWVDADGAFLPYPAIIYGFAEGVTKPSSVSSGVSGVGTYFPPELRPVLGAQWVEHLARIHRFDWRKADLSAFDRVEPGTRAIELQLNWYERLWEEDANEDVPLMRLAMAWLRRHMPAVDQVSVIHGDYRTGNFLYTEHDQRITAWLDWELAHLGDRHEDLAWACSITFGFLAEDKKTFLVGGFFPKDEFLAAYEKASGLKVDARAMQFYEVFNTYKAIAIVLATGYRVAHNGKTHQDILVAWLSGVSYVLLNELRQQMEQVS
jgi:aminoglycoside phosphotransferase (APT) family kinase protein